ncbi:MAG: T9SS type A sorting domain-containing protein, partial [Bacteroidia bacterium]
PFTTGISDNNESVSLNVFPNPVTDNINVAFNLNQSENISMNLFSVDGKLIRTFENKTIDQGYFNQTYSTEGISKGIYFLRLSSNNFSESKKILVN